MENADVSGTPAAGGEVSDVANVLKDTPEAESKALEHFGKSGDMDDYIAEREDQELKRAGDPEYENPTRKSTRNERRRKLIEALRSENQSLKGQGRGDQPEQSGDALERLSKVEPEVGLESEEVPVEEIVRREKLAAAFDVRAEQFASETPDFADTVKGTFSTLSETFGTAPPPDFIEAVAKSPVGPQILYELAQPENVAAIIDLYQMSPLDRARALGAIESATLTRNEMRRQGHVRHDSRKATQAPAPIRPLNGGSVPPIKTAAEAAKANDMEAYVRIRNKEEAARRR